MKKQVCNYSVIRFLPYPETEEFVCVGVVMLCPQAPYFRYKVEKKRRERVTGFFPELDPQIFLQGRKIFEEQLKHLEKILGGDERPGQMRLPLPDINPTIVFKELVRPRESLFRFSGIGVTLADDPVSELKRLFDHFVNRQFAQHEAYQEAQMAKQLQTLFREHSIRNYRGETFGDAYKINIPFVAGDIASPQDMKLIKPLNLAQNDTTQMADHAYIWQKRVKILLERDIRPERILFPVKKATKDKRAEVANGFCQEFLELGVRVIEHGRQDEIIQFANAL